jgi:hypothetical protein
MSRDRKLGGGTVPFETYDAAVKNAYAALSQASDADLSRLQKQMSAIYLKARIEHLWTGEVDDDTVKVSELLIANGGKEIEL